MTDDFLRVNRVASPVRAQVLENLRTAILEMRFRPGQRLIERELIDATGVSRTSVREALRELAAEGLVTTIPNKGTVVAGVTREEARQIYELRSCLEGLAARLFVERATQDELAALHDAFRGIEKAYRDGNGAVVSKDSFYDALFNGAHNDMLRQCIAGLHARVTVLRALSLSQPGRLDESLEELRRILEAVDAGDGRAASRAASAHVEAAARASLEALDEAQEGRRGSS